MTHGDVVKLKIDSFRISKNDVGVVIDSFGDNWVTVRFFNGKIDVFLVKNVELIKRKDNEQ